MGMFQVGKQLYKFADSLFDDAAVQAKTKPVKKPRAQMTPEEHIQQDQFLAESLEVRRAKRRAKIDAMTPEELLAHKASEAERMKAQRAGRTPEKLEADRAIDAQRARERRAAETPEETAERNRKNKEAKQAKIAAMTPEEYAAHLQKGADDYARRKAAMSEEEIEAVRARGRQYAKDNPEVGRRLRAARRAAQEQRTAPWSSKEEIDEIYRIAQEVSAETGVAHHVDHIIPLRGRNDSVSGLHHQDNLLIVPWDKNLGKGNRYTPGSQSPMGGVDVARSLFEEVLKSQGR